MTLHDSAIKYVSKVEGGTPNTTERFIGVKRSFIPDIIGKEGSMHEVEVLEHKFSKAFLNEYLDAIKFGVPRKRSYMVGWLVIPNFEDIVSTFDEVRIIGEGKRGFVPIHYQRNPQYKKFKRDLEAREAKKSE